VTFGSAKGRIELSVTGDEDLQPAKLTFKGMAY
jgi:hypothetical protein